MKKFLFATSALVALSGAAYAEVAVTGDGRMGMVWDGDDMQFSSRARAKFTMTGETDSGLSFGGAFRVDQESDYTAGRTGSSRSAARGTAGSVFISGTYGKLSMGDVVSASEAAIGDLPEIGYTAGEFAGDAEEVDYLTGDGVNEDQGPTALYEYTFNGVKLFASMTDGSRRACDAVSGRLGCYDTTGINGDNTTDIAYSLAAAYEMGAYSFGLGYGKHGDASEIVLGGTAAFDAFKVKGFYAKYDDRAASSVGQSALPDGTTYDQAYGLGVEYAMANGVGIQGVWIRREVDFASGVVTDASDSYDAYGIGASYDLGGGATLAGAVMKNEMYTDNETRADFGVKFAF